MPRLMSPSRSQFAKPLLPNIDADIARCEPITLEQWKQRGLGERIRECYYGLYEGLF